MFEKKRILQDNFKLDSSTILLTKLYKNVRILEVKSDCFLAATGYKLYKFKKGKWQYFSEILDPKYSFLSNFKLISRFLRAEIHLYKTLNDDIGICIAKKGIFIENKTTGKFEKVFHVLRGSRPMSLCEDKEGTIYFGEYFNNKSRTQVHIYASYNRGKDWNIVYTFLPNSIRHIHSIQVDPFTGFLWIVTGDEDGECIIAYTKDKFKTLEIVAKGGHEYRACKLLFYKDNILYGTDSPYVINCIKSINRKDFSIKDVQEVQGSVINSCQVGNYCMIGTTVEPSKINKEKNSYLWISKNGERWHQVTCFKKDIYNMTLFQFGNIRFPNYHSSEIESLFFSGHALRKIDGHSVEIPNFRSILNSSNVER